MSKSERVHIMAHTGCTNKNNPL